MPSFDGILLFITQETIAEWKELRSNIEKKYTNKPIFRIVNMKNTPVTPLQHSELCDPDLASWWTLDFENKEKIFAPLAWLIREIQASHV